MATRRVLNETGGFSTIEYIPKDKVEPVITPAEAVVERVNEEAKEAAVEEVEKLEKLPKDMMEWTKSQLLDHCAWLGIEANGGLNKQAIITRIENANKASL